MTTLDKATLESLVLDAFVAWTQQARADAALGKLTEWIDASLTTHGEASPYAARFEQRRNTPREYTARKTAGINVLAQKYPAAYRAVLGYKRPTLRSTTTYHGELWSRYADEFVPALPLFTLPDRLEADAAAELRADLLRTRRTHKVAVDAAADVLRTALAVFPDDAGAHADLHVGKGTGFEVRIKRGSRDLDLNRLRDEFPDVYASFVTETPAVSKIVKPYTVRARATGDNVDEDDTDY